MVLDPQPGKIGSGKSKENLKLASPFTFLHVSFGSDNFRLDFRVRKTDLARRWVSKVRVAQRLGYSIDEPERFYGFDDTGISIKRSIDYVNRQIDVINSFQPLVEKRLDDINDQDTLNYLHNIFERYHGLLDQQHSKVWRSAPPDVRRALALLNTAVHRCESVQRGNAPRAVITYYGLPKKHIYQTEDYDLIERDWQFGTVHTCYAEIGKTLFDMSVDHDHHMGDELFSPFRHLSADFVIQFNDADRDRRNELEENMWDYYDQNREFFQSRGYDRDHPALKMGVFPVADLETDLPRSEMLNHLHSRQHVNQVWFS